jgi:hypothetical protein
VKFLTFVVLLREIIGCHFIRNDNIMTPIAHMSTAEPYCGALKIVSGGM